MARSPIQVQGRGPSQPANVGNRSQYLRPAKDNQNSRMLAKAFSQINSAFSAYNKNQAALQNRMMADQLSDAQAHQDEQERIAAEYGTLSGLTGQDYTSEFTTNELSLQAYEENKAGGLISKAISDLQVTASLHDAYGNPSRQTEWENFYNSSLSQIISEHSGGNPAVAARAMQSAINNRNNAIINNQRLVRENMIREETISMRSEFIDAMINAGSPEELLSIFEETRETQNTIRGSVGREQFRDALSNTIGSIPYLPASQRNVAFENMATLLELDERGKNPILDNLDTQTRRRILSDMESANMDLTRIQSTEQTAAENQRKSTIITTGDTVWNNYTQSGVYPDFQNIKDEYGLDVANAVRDRFQENLEFYNNTSFVQEEDTPRLSRAHYFFNEGKLMLDQMYGQDASSIDEARREYVMTYGNLMTREQYLELNKYEPEYFDFSKTQEYNAAVANLGRTVTTYMNISRVDPQSVISNLKGLEASQKETEMRRQLEASLYAYVKNNPDVDLETARIAVVNSWLKTPQVNAYNQLIRTPLDTLQQIYEANISNVAFGRYVRIVEDDPAIFGNSISFAGVVAESETQTGDFVNAATNSNISMSAQDLENAIDNFREEHYDEVFDYRQNRDDSEQTPNPQEIPEHLRGTIRPPN